MLIFTHLNEIYKTIEQRLEDFLAGYDDQDDNWRMGEISKILEMLQVIQKIDRNLIYPHLASIESVTPVLTEAELNHQKINRLVEQTINIHVDEPNHSFFKRVSELYDVIRTLMPLDQKLMKAFQTLVPPDVQQKINEQLTEQFLQNPQAVPAS